MLNNFHSKKDMQLDPQIASQMLSNIFDACDIEQNSVPLETLTSYSNYRKERYVAQKVVLAIVMILFFLLPILFIAPEFTMELKNSEIPGKPYVELVTTHLIPTEKIEAFMGGEKVPVYETSTGTYQIIPTKNGQLKVTVTLITDQHSTRTIDIGDVDMQAPKIRSSEHTNGNLIIYFEENSGVLDYEGIYAKSVDGTTVKPVSYDERNLSVTFKYPNDTLNIFVSDKSENSLQIVVTLK